MLRKPSKEDVEKLNAEVNQIVNQRFNLITLAITTFGVLSALMVNLAQAADTEHSPFIIDILLSIFLLVTALWSKLLSNTLRTFTTYLRITGQSNWEHDWEQFRHSGPYNAYSKTQALILLILNALGFTFAVILGSDRHLKLLQGIPWIATIVFLMTEILIIKLELEEFNIKGLWMSQKEIEDRWMQIEDRDSDIT